MNNTKTKIDPRKMYSARQALSHVPAFKKEAEFREFLKADAATRNIFNAKIYTVKTQQRVVISGEDLLRGLSLYIPATV